MNNLNIPTLSYDLIEELDKSISSCVLTNRDFDKSIQQMWYEAGQRALVDSLKLRLSITSDPLSLKGDIE
jgi:hypothetical protein